MVTGAAGNGICRSAALSFAKAGASVVVNYLKNKAGADAVVSHIRAAGGIAAAVQADVFKREDCERLVASTIELFGRVDACVIGPGADWNTEGLQELDAEKSMRDVSREILPVYQLLPPLLRNMAQRRYGRIVGIASNMDIPSPSFSYNAAKEARIGALLLAAREAWKDGATINVVAPGPVEPFASLGEAVEHCAHGSAWAERGRVTPQDIADGILYLCSNEAKYVSGCVLPFLF